MSSQELADWAVFEQVTGPLDPRVRGDMQAGTIASVVANANRNKGSKTYQPKDFIPEWYRARQTEQEQLAIAKAWTKTLGGTVEE